MRILLLGSSQTKHISNLFSKEGYKIVKSECKNGGFLGKIEFFSKLLVTDMIYHVGGIDISSSLFFRIAYLLRKKIVVHWIGTDVLNFTKAEKKGINRNCINLVVSEQLQNELKEIDINSFVVPIFPPNFSCDVMTPPKKHSVLSYVPETREEFYGMTLLKKIAEHFSDIDFHIVANSGKNDNRKLHNMHYHGFLNADELKKMYKECSVLFRFPEHDGLPVMVLEALGYGRTVIYRYEFPYVYTPRSGDFNDVITVFEKVFSTSPKAAEEASAFVAAEFSMARQIQLYKASGTIR